MKFLKLYVCMAKTYGHTFSQEGCCLCGKRVLLIRVESMTKIKTTLTIEKSLYGGF